MCSLYVDSQFIVTHATHMPLRLHSQQEKEKA